jgi:hypothetical protein
MSVLRPPKGDSKSRPPGMPAYPEALADIPKTPEELKRELISDVYHADRSLNGGDFTSYAEGIRAKLKLKKLNESLWEDS